VHDAVGDEVAAVNDVGLVAELDPDDIAGEGERNRSGIVDGEMPLRVEVTVGLEPLLRIGVEARVGATRQQTDKDEASEAAHLRA